MNAVYSYVYAHLDIAAQYLRGALAPEAVALAKALGGSTATFDKRIPIPGNVPGAKYHHPI